MFLKINENFVISFTNSEISSKLVFYCAQNVPKKSKKCSLFENDRVAKVRIHGLL